MGTITGLAGAAATAYASDERVKNVKKKVGETPDGLGLYDYTYKGDDTPQTGVLAQEVEQARPDAMGPTVDGVKTVNYDKLGMAPPEGAAPVPDQRGRLDRAISPARKSGGKGKRVSVRGEHG